MAHVTSKLSSSLEGALAGGGDPATSPLYVFTPFLRLIVLVAVSGVAGVTFGATVWLVVFTIFVVSAMYRLVMQWVTDGSGGSGLSEEEFGPWAVKVNAAITFIEYTLTFLVSMAALVTFVADRFPTLNDSLFGLPGLQYRVLLAVSLSLATGWAVNRGPRMAAVTFGPATGGVLLLLWAMVASTLWRHVTGDPLLAGVGVLPDFNIKAFSPAATAPGGASYLGITLGGFSRILAVMTGIEVFANLVAAYSGTEAEKAKKAFGSLTIIMGTTAVTMLIVGPAIFAISDPANEHVSVFTQTMDQLLPGPLAYLGTLVSVLVLLSACAASAQGLQNLSLGLATRHYVPAALGRVNEYGVADKPVWIEVAICCVCFVAFGTSEGTYLAIYAAGVFILLSMTGWAASKRLTRQLSEREPGGSFDSSAAATLVGAVVAALLTSIATVIIFRERFFEGAWTFLLFIPLLYVAFSYFRGRLGAPSPALERLGEIEEATLGGFGPGQMEPLYDDTTAIAVEPAIEWPAAPAPGAGWRSAVKHIDHLLVPLDGTLAGERSLPLAVSLITVSEGQLTLLAVAPEHGNENRTDDGGGNVSAPAIPRLQYLEATAERLRSQGIRVDVQVRGGPVAETVCAVAESEKADAVVMSIPGQSYGDEDWLGDVAGPVVRRISRPVILVPPGSVLDEGLLDLDRAVVALDGSEFAERVLPYARGLSSRFGTELLLVSVPEVPAAETYGPLVDLIVELRAEAERSAHEYLSGVISVLHDEDLPARGVVAGSRPARTILAVADFEHADLTMIATHGRGRLGRLLMGSIAERVLRGATGPVFVVPIRESIADQDH